MTASFYAPVDDLIIHFQSIITSSSPHPRVQQQYAGFVAFSAVTAYELCYRQILVEFAEKKHATFGAFVRKKLERINGRIQYKEIKEMVGDFGQKYVDRLTERMQKKNDEELRAGRGDVLTSYSNIITYRHKLAHTGKMPPHVTFGEVTTAFTLGKCVYECLEGSMKR